MVRLLALAISPDDIISFKLRRLWRGPTPSLIGFLKRILRPWSPQTTTVPTTSGHSFKREKETERERKGEGGGGRADQPPFPHPQKAALSPAVPYWNLTRLLRCVGPVEAMEPAPLAGLEIHGFRTTSGGSLLLFDRNVLRNFRKDGHNWRKKKDGKTVQEAHEKLKIGVEERIHVYYARSEDDAFFYRRNLDRIVLVHYRRTLEVCLMLF
ncbi:hypothetical protein Taro_036329 [Colocasia esculenta]|uniref:CG-1 domain-containing protein n=1 Tax=Colocasia esculenta TaxID=4460 RepID=A0A843W6H0_COLES|nr:hypothetical protein [Colocasia esculenta]